MNLIKRITNYRRIDLPQVVTIRTIKGRLAYACLEEDSREISERAPQGICLCCGSANIISIDGLLNHMRSEIHQRLAEVRRRKAKEKPAGEKQASVTEVNTEGFYWTSLEQKTL